MNAERLYYGDAQLRQFTARVTGVREAQAGGEAGLSQVALDRTAFYPSSGGQPFDTGWMRAGTTAVAVTGVEEDEDGEVWHRVSGAVEAGAKVEGEINWERRLDHMQQHTGQHLLSAVLARECQAATLSFHLGAEISNIDLGGGPLAPAALEHVETQVNRIIAEDRPVRVRMAGRAEAEALLAAGALRKLPERAGAIRLIEIADCDLNACGGTHVSSTGQIGGLWLRGTEKISRGVRVHFVCGLRAVRAGRADLAALRQATEALSVGAAELPAAIGRLQAEVKAAAKERLRLREELAEAEAARLSATAPFQNGLRLIVREMPGCDGDYLRLLASRVAAATPGTVVILDATGASGARVILARSGDLAFHCGAMLKQALAERGLRGGGGPDLAQCEVPITAVGEFRSSLAALIRAATVSGAEKG